ncbi:MAG: hypothetical protein ACR2HJ_09270 [Fimbriimonadales bacterium]
MRTTFPAYGLVLSLIAFLLGCTKPPAAHHAGHSPEAVIVSAVSTEKGIQVEKRVRGAGLPQSSKALPDSSGLFVDDLNISANGDLVLITATNRDPNKQSNLSLEDTMTPTQNSTWILRTETLDTVANFELSGPVSQPAWVSPRSFRFAQSDIGDKSLDVTVDESAALSKQYIDQTSIPNESKHSVEAAEIVNKRGIEWPVIVHGPSAFNPMQFSNHKDLAVVSEDGNTIIVCARAGESFTESQVLLLRRRGETWTTTRLGREWSPIFVLVEPTLSVLFSDNGVQKCRLYDTTSGKLVEEFRADAVDIKSVIAGRAASENNVPTSEPADYIIQAFPNGIGMWPVRGPTSFADRHNPTAQTTTNQSPSFPVVGSPTEVVQEFRLLSCDFLRSGRQLVLARPYVYDPPHSDAFLTEQLFMIWGKRAFIVDSLDDLRGHVMIRRAYSALDFVRLRTSPVTFHAFRPYMFFSRRNAENYEMVKVAMQLEVARPAVFETLPAFGAGPLWPRVVQIDGYWGWLSSSTATACKLVDATVAAHGREYEIRRTIVEASGLKTPQLTLFPYVVYDVVELVAQNGTYRVRNKRVNNSRALKNVRWEFRTNRM